MVRSSFGGEGFFERHPDTLVIIFQEIDERNAFGQVAFGGKGAEGEHPARIRRQLSVSRG